MKTYALFAMLCFLIHNDASGKIINGYESGIKTAQSSLKHLRGLSQDKNVMTRLDRVTAFILHYQLTEKLLEQFKTISPELYNQIDTIRDFKGRLVDVYVKFVTQSEIQEGALATTNIDQIENDNHAYNSSYGAHTVSIKILTVKHALLILAHEFGHVMYQVPNLASYFEFFSRNYGDIHMKANYMGHKANDPSGQSALIFEKIFREENVKFILTNGKPENPILIRDKIAKNIK